MSSISPLIADLSSSNLLRWDTMHAGAVPARSPSPRRHITSESGEPLIKVPMLS